MKKNLLLLVTLLVALSMVVVACAPATAEPTAEEPVVEEPVEEEPVVEETEEPVEETEEPVAEETEEVAEETEEAEAPDAGDFKAGMVTDTGGVDDRSFNETSWNGLLRAEEELGIQVTVLESQQQTDYATNLAQLIEQDYNIIITVGFLLGEDTAIFGADNPDTLFAIVDFAYDEPEDNVKGLIFATDEAAFLTGYAAAAMSQTGVVGMFGGLEIPTVTIFMDGFAAGVAYYNEQNDANVTVLGRDLFAGNFESTDDGRRIGEDLIAEGADIIMPVAGPVGLGTAAAAMDNPGVMIVGVDTDWCVSAEEFCSVMLTSVVKNMDVAVFDAVSAAFNDETDNWSEAYVGTLENGGVEMAPFNEFEDQVPEGLQAELDEIQQLIIDGEIVVTDYYP